MTHNEQALDRTAFERRALRDMLREQARVALCSARDELTQARETLASNERANAPEYMLAFRRSEVDATFARYKQASLAYDKYITPD